MCQEKYPVPLTQDRVAIATSSLVDGKYRYRGIFKLLGFRSNDVNVFYDPRGGVYIVAGTSAVVSASTGARVTQHTCAGA